MGLSVLYNNVIHAFELFFLKPNVRERSAAVHQTIQAMIIVERSQFN